MFEADIARLKENGLKLRGTAIIAELLPPPELKTASGLILHAPSDHVRGHSLNAHKLEVAKVLDTGPGEWDPDKQEYIPLDVAPGTIIVLNQYSYSLVSILPGLTKPLANKLVIVPASGIFASYPNEEAYEQAQKG